jgi:hypothetical protein
VSSNIAQSRACNRDAIHTHTLPSSIEAMPGSNSFCSVKGTVVRLKPGSQKVRREL